MTLQLKDEFSPSPYGLANGGATCYWNTLLQCLLSCTQITETSVKNNYPLNSLIGQLATMAYKADNMAGINFLRTFLITMHQKELTFNFGIGQESTSEGLILLVDLLPAEIKSLFLHRYVRYKVCGNCGHESDKIRLESIHFEFFEFKVCLIESAEKFAEHLLEKADTIPDYKCDSCGQMHPNTIGVERLTMASEIIVILFNKYDMISRTKNYFIPDEFELPSNNGQPLKYKLVGQARHNGSLHGGHYWAMIRRKGKVYMANDSAINEVENFDRNPATYIAFYTLYTNN
jgi:ubiquitin carboxyl-terminal hydrolase 2/21